MRCLVMVGTLILLVTATAVGAEKLVTTPSAEEVAANGMPKGWGRYVGAGGVRLAVTTDEKHSGKSAACLELDKWHTPKAVHDSPENHSVNGAVILADNDGYRVNGALPCTPGARYAFSFWYKGTVPSAKVTITNTQTGAVRHTTTEATGKYVATQLPVGIYEVRAEAAGFKTFIQVGGHLRLRNTDATEKEYCHKIGDENRG